MAHSWVSLLSGLLNAQGLQSDPIGHQLQSRALPSLHPNFEDSVLLLLFFHPIIRRPWDQHVTAWFDSAKSAIHQPSGHGLIEDPQSLSPDSETGDDNDDDVMMIQDSQQRCLYM